MRQLQPPGAHRLLDNLDASLRIETLRDDPLRRQIRTAIAVYDARIRGFERHSRTDLVTVEHGRGDGPCFGDLLRPDDGFTFVGRADRDSPCFIGLG
ncbi:hypothetical protein, partial [Burkholderia multivorans]|uniref:hypothetical protein n=1 Tax=Burkholderia multivorans TaxID=87883 RepID=UPI0021BF78CB